MFAVASAVPLIQYNLPNVWFVFPFITHNSHSNCSSKLLKHYCEPSSLHVSVHQGGYSHVIFSCTHLSCQGLDSFSKLSLILPNHPAQIGITCPQIRCFCAASNGPVMLLFRSPTMSSVNFTSKVLNLLLSELTTILAVLSTCIVLVVLLVYIDLHAVNV